MGRPVPCRTYWRGGGLPAVIHAMEGRKRILKNLRESLGNFPFLKAQKKIKNEK
jgi:hypothetical protein